MNFFRKHLSRSMLWDVLNVEKGNTSKMKGSHLAHTLQVTQKKMLTGKREKYCFATSASFLLCPILSLNSTKNIHERKANGIKSRNYDAHHSTGLSRKMSITNGDVTLWKNPRKQ